MRDTLDMVTKREPGLVEKFGGHAMAAGLSVWESKFDRFTQVFEEDARQMDLFKGIGVVPMIEGVLGAKGHQGRDGLLATLGVTGSGKVRHEESDRL